MKITNATFITSVANRNNFYPCNKPLVCVVGKSNVGKSSIINMLAGQKKLARTSVTPGRTRLVNYFDFGEFILADLPGYGFAKVSKEEKLKWAELMEEFLATQPIKLVISLMDIRHNPTEEDKMMVNYLYHYAIPFSIVATKSDKLSKSKIKPQLMEIAKHLRVGIADLTASSAETGLGKSEILNIIDKAIKIKNEDIIGE